MAIARRMMGLMTALAGLGFLGLRGRADGNPKDASADRAAERQRRQARLRAAGIDGEKLRQFIARYRKIERSRLEAQGILGAMAPRPGGILIGSLHRSPAGERLLEEAKDMLFALLFGDAECGVQLPRTERELLVLTAPRAKSGVLEFMQAANDTRADNVILEVEYGEMADESVGHGILAALRLINLLEVNEQVLNAHISNVEERSLLD